MTQHELPLLTANISVVRITSEEGRRQGDVLRLLRDFVVPNEPMYPNIRRWFDQKITPGIVSQERAAYVVLAGDRPIGAAIAKRGANSKLCHLSVDSDWRSRNVGELLFSLIALELRKGARDIHFTLPESVWCSQKEFFSSFGFADPCEAGTQYRLFERELRCAAPASRVLQFAASKLQKVLPQFSSDGRGRCSLVLSIRPQWAEAILSGRKTVEIRRVFSSKWEGHRAFIYCTRPVASLVGKVTISRVVSGSPAAIWGEYRERIGCQSHEFEAYSNDARRVFALELLGVLPFSSSLPMAEVSTALGWRPRAPQSYEAVNSASPWDPCIRLAEVLNGTTVRPRDDSGAPWLLR